MLLLDVDKILAGDAQSTEYLCIVRGVHRSEYAMRSIDKPGETLSRPRDPSVVADEDVLAHRQLGKDDLLIMPNTPASVLEVEPDHLLLVLPQEPPKHCDAVVHPVRLVCVHDREVRPALGRHGEMLGELLISVLPWERHWTSVNPLFMGGVYVGMVLGVLGRSKV